MSSLPDGAPQPRLCIIVKWTDFDGYGFNLHADKSKPGQYIGKVDEKSPAEAAGLLEGDRIIEVNGVNIANENHKQVVQRIKAVPNETRLLVVDNQTDKYYKNKNIVVRGSQENVLVRSSAREKKDPPAPESKPAAAVSNGHHDEADNRSVSSAASSSAASEGSTQPQHEDAPALSGTDKSNNEAAAHHTMEEAKSHSPSPPPGEEAKVLDALAAELDRSSLTGSDDLSDKDVNAPIGDVNAPVGDMNAPGGESLTEVSETDASHSNETETLDEKESVQHTDDDKDLTAPSASPTPAVDQESDLEAEYDNVEIGAGRAAAAGVTGDTSRRLSSSSSGSRSSHESTPGTDIGTGTSEPLTQSPMSTSPSPPPSLDPTPAQESAPARSSPRQETTTSSTTVTNSNANSSPRSQPNNNAYNSSGLNLNMSAAEMRALLARKKKADPRKDTVDLRKKYEIIQNM